VADRAAGFIQGLGDLIGSPGQSELNYEKGRALGANTEVALAQARERVEKERARQALAGQLKTFLPANIADASATALSAGAGLGDVMTMRDKNQEYDFRATAGDPAKSFAERNIALQGVSNAPVERFGTAGEGLVQDKFSDATQPTVTPLGEALIGQRKAAADLAATRGEDILHPRGVGGADKPPSGYEWSVDPATGQRALKPITGGPADPQRAPAIGSREATFLQRTVTGAKLGLENIRNIMDLPTGASTGILGIGGSPGHSVLQATRDTLRNQIADDEVQAYNTMLAGLSRNLATIESSGLAPSGQFTGSFDTLAFRAGDTEATKLHKLAEMRQIIEYGMDVAVNNPRINPEQKQYLQTIIDEIRQVVPFTHADVTKLSSTPDGRTLADMAQSHGLNRPQGGVTTPHAAPAAPTVPAAAPITATGPNGQKLVLKDGQWQPL
jgi:hypothetical protein